jgi:hypothetical protein
MSVFAKVQDIHFVLERCEGILVVVIDNDPTSERTILVILDAHRRANVCAVDINIPGMDMIV